MKQHYTLLCACALTLNGPLKAQRGALQFDGIDDRVLIPNTALNEIGTGPFTVEAWVQGEEGNPSEHIRLFSNRTAIGVGFIFGFHGLWGGSTSKMLMVQMDDFNYIRVNNGTYNGSLLDGSCHHVAMTRDADSVRWYADGEQFGSFHNTLSHSTASTAENMIVGDDAPDPAPFAGELSHLRLWNYARTGAEIVATMDEAIVGTTPGLVGDWQMTDGSGQVAADQTFAAHGQLGTSMGIDDSDPVWVDESCLPDFTGLNEARTNAPFSIYVDHSGASLTLAFRTLMPRMDVRLVDITGRVALRTNEGPCTSLQIPIDALSAGVYTAVLDVAGSRLATRFVKP